METVNSKNFPLKIRKLDSHFALVLWEERISYNFKWGALQNIFINILQWLWSLDNDKRIGHHQKWHRTASREQSHIKISSQILVEIRHFFSLVERSLFWSAQCIVCWFGFDSTLLSYWRNSISFQISATYNFKHLLFCLWILRM